MPAQLEKFIAYSGACGGLLQIDSDRNMVGISLILSILSQNVSAMLIPSLSDGAGTLWKGGASASQSIQDTASTVVSCALLVVLHPSCSTRKFLRSVCSLAAVLHVDVVLNRRVCRSHVSSAVV